MKFNTTKGMRSSLVKLLLVFACFTSTLGLAPSVWALDLQQAKQEGLVGETESGYLAAVKGDSAEVKTLVDTTNALRRKEYERIATSNGIAIDKVEALAGRKAIGKTPAGQYVNIGGSWEKK